jgi:hypothetical protein
MNAGPKSVERFSTADKKLMVDTSTSGRTVNTSELFAYRSLLKLTGSKKPTHLSAPAYVEALMTWTQSILDDERHFPQKIGMSSPPPYPFTVKYFVHAVPALPLFFT